jgi:hypothetical protein
MLKTGERVSVIAEEVNIFSAPDRNSKKVGAEKKGASGKVVQDTNPAGFCQVSFDDEKTGFLKEDKLALFGATGVAAAGEVTFTALRIIDINLPNSFVGIPYAGGINYVGGKLPLTFSIHPVPAGLKVDPLTGSVDGVPEEPGTFTVHFSAVDGAGQIEEGKHTFRIYPKQTREPGRRSIEYFEERDGAKLAVYDDGSSQIITDIPTRQAKK